MRTHVYIDGFHLYYGLLRGTPYRWLDLERFCDGLLPKNDVQKIYYFTAKVDARRMECLAETAYKHSTLN